MSLEVFDTTMKALGNRPRTIRVSVPSAPGPWPVLYMHDGQNLFRDVDATYGTCWRVEETVAAMGLKVLVVGIDSGEGTLRLDELSAWRNDKEKGGGEGEAYLSFLADELRPLIDAQYSTLRGPEVTFLAGSSLGALASLYGACRRPEAFGRAACFSPAFWFAGEALTPFLAGAPQPQQLYLDIGTAEGPAAEHLESLNGTLRVHDQLAMRARPGTVKLVIDQGGQHNEAAWARRLPTALRWLLADLI